MSDSEQLKFHRSYSPTDYRNDPDSDGGGFYMYEKQDDYEEEKINWVMISDTLKVVYD